MVEISKYAQIQQKLFNFRVTLEHLFLSIMRPREEVSKCARAAIFNPDGLNVVLNPVLNKPAQVVQSNADFQQQLLGMQGNAAHGYVEECKIQ